MNKFYALLGLILCSTLSSGDLPGGAPRPNTPFIEPYILLGESGKSVDITAKKIIGRFFMQNIEVLGKYSPANDPDRYVLVVTHPELQKAVRSDHPASAFTAVIRIGITTEGQMTYVSCQNPEYWANAFLQETYVEYADNFICMKGYLLDAMPKMRGRFRRTFGGNQVDGLTLEEVRQYQYNRRAESLENVITLIRFDSYQQAVANLDQRMETSISIEKVFELEFPEQEFKLIGIALKNPPLERRILEQLDSDKLKRTASLPLEILVEGKRVLMLSPRYRLPLSFPDLDRKSFRQLKKLQQELMQTLSTLVN
ncbi:hypothetical protein ACFL5M_03615 [Candidatus Neomarinimicrobiota bacterium]